MIYIYIRCKRNEKCEYCRKQHTDCRSSFHSLHKKYKYQHAQENQPTDFKQIPHNSRKGLLFRQKPKINRRGNNASTYEHLRLDFREQDRYNRHNQVVQLAI